MRKKFVGEKSCCENKVEEATQDQSHSIKRRKLQQYENKIIILGESRSHFMKIPPQKIIKNLNEEC